MKLFVNRQVRYLIFAMFFSSLPARAIDIVPADFKSILTSHSDSQRIWNYADNQDIYIFDFPGLALQGRTFNRAMQLTEQFNEPYKHILSKSELSKYLESIRRNQANFAFGHDFLVSELVLFFNLAVKDKTELLPEELLLRDFLLQQKLMSDWRGFYRSQKPDAVILSIPQVQEKHDNEPRINELARRAIFTHEIAHAEYYTNPYYAEYCRKFWTEKLDDIQRSVFQKFLSNYNYSINQQELLINEMQAYLMFTPDPNSINAGKLGITDEEFETMKSLFRQGRPPTKLSM